MHVEEGAPREEGLKPGIDAWRLHEPATTINHQDLSTPDGWVHRDPRLQRHNGGQPFSGEPPVASLVAASPITPTSLHYVRNYGPVPQLHWDTHVITVAGLVGHPVSLTMEQLVSLPAVTLPVTLVCAGNRGREHNMAKQSMGLSWGPCAFGTSDWTGVRVTDILALAGITKPSDTTAKHICFNSIKGQLPHSTDGSYGTSLELSYALNTANDVLIAYKQNGRWLMPDHGFPVRAIVPGQICGRMVRWLSEIELTETESDNHYHYYDNRLLPSHVDAELAATEGWWHKPDYIINELSINSAIARPWHDEVVSLEASSSYTMQGYAYTGGGRKVIRVEVSLDGGVMWTQADIKRFNEPTAAGKHWCNVLWSLEVATMQFVMSPTRELLVRAWDSSQNGQPQELTWNVLGLMNNCWYRVKMHTHVDEQGNLGLRFQHPAPVPTATSRPGWREQDMLDKQAQAPTAAAAAVAAKAIAAAAVAAAATSPVAVAPRSGPQPPYTPPRSADARPSSSRTSSVPLSVPASVPSSAVAAPRPLVALDPRKKVKLALAEKHVLSHNVRRFRFALQSPSHKLGLPTGKHVFLYASVDGNTIMRAYTPTSSQEVLGHVDLVIKVYRGSQHPNFPDGGRMSQHLEGLEIGDTVEFKGPVGHFEYLGRGEYLLNRKRFSTGAISLIAGGTGITPCWQVLRAVLADPQDTTQIALLYANTTAEDVLLRAELDELAALHPGRFKLWYTLTRAPEGWQYGNGRVTQAMLTQHLLPPGDGAIAALCGPAGMIEHCCLPHLEAMGYAKEALIQF